MTAYIPSASALYTASLRAGLRLAQVQVSDGSEHVASNLAHAAAGMYAWEAAQFVLYDVRLLCALLARQFHCRLPWTPNSSPRLTSHRGRNVGMDGGEECEDAGAGADVVCPVRPGEPQAEGKDGLTPEPDAIGALTSSPSPPPPAPTRIPAARHHQTHLRVPGQGFDNDAPSSLSLHTLTQLHPHPHPRSRSQPRSHLYSHNYTQPCPRPHTQSCTRPHPRNDPDDPPSPTRLGVLAQTAHLALRACTAAALVSLLTILDAPGTSPSSSTTSPRLATSFLAASPSSVARSLAALSTGTLAGAMTCATWKAVNLVAWVSPLASFALTNLFLFLRVVAVWIPPIPIPSLQPDEETTQRPAPTIPSARLRSSISPPASLPATTSAATSAYPPFLSDNPSTTPVIPSPSSLPATHTSAQTPTYLRLLPAALTLLHTAQYVLLAAGAARLATLPSLSGDSCPYAPSSATENVRTDEGGGPGGSESRDRKMRRAAMPPGFGIGGAFQNALGSRELVIGICVYYMLLDLFALVLLVLGIARSAEFDYGAASDDAVLNSPECIRTPPLAFATPRASSGDSDSDARDSDSSADTDGESDSREHAGEESCLRDAPSLRLRPKSVGIVPGGRSELVDAGGGRTAGAAGAGLRLRSGCEKRWARVWDAGCQQGLPWVLAIVLMKIGMLVCVILNASPDNTAASVDFQTMCMCIPALVIISIAMNRLFFHVTQASPVGDGFMERHPRPAPHGHSDSYMEGGSADTRGDPARAPLPSYVDRALYVRRVRWEADAGAVVRTIGGSEHVQQQQRRAVKGRRRRKKAGEREGERERKREREVLGAGAYAAEHKIVQTSEPSERRCGFDLDHDEHPQELCTLDPLLPPNSPAPAAAAAAGPSSPASSICTVRALPRHDRHRW